ncbi:MAG: hypothetical protein IJV40_14365 [Oscillospiraceae bacterium]|nr:hypothetical protein [Oscillospiraceae bacterium]
MTARVEEFLIRHGMLDPNFDILECAERMSLEMKSGLWGEESSYLMIPTYLKTTGKIPEDEYVAVVDAGGTNFRSALAHFKDGRCIEERVRKAGMPGIGKPASWDEFISFVADSIEDLMTYTDRIGFCFSYSADITPEIDGRVNCIDKEVSIVGCEGQLVGKSLCEELTRRGYPGKRAVIINDTAAVQLGGMAKHLNDGHEMCFGQVSGTGTNTCCTVPGSQIKKLGSTAYDMIVNLECGMYDGVPQGLFDRELDFASHNPGQKRFEKMTAGVYLGELCRRALRQAANEGLLSQSCAEKIWALPHMNSVAPDAWACGEGLEELTDQQADAEFISEIARFFFERSAKLMCANLIAMAELTDAGRSGKAAVYAEGSLVQRNHVYRPALTALLDQYMKKAQGRDISLFVEEDTTLPGAAAAALLNLH